MLTTGSTRMLLPNTTVQEPHAAEWKTVTLWFIWQFPISKSNGNGLYARFTVWSNIVSEYVTK